MTTTEAVLKATGALRYQNAKGQTYYLHGKQVTLQNGRRQQIYYFAREEKAAETVSSLPDGYEVAENQRTGLPFLKRRATSG